MTISFLLVNEITQVQAMYLCVGLDLFCTGELQKVILAVPSMVRASLARQVSELARAHLHYKIVCSTNAPLDSYVEVKTIGTSKI